MEFCSHAGTSRAQTTPTPPETQAQHSPAYPARVETTPRMPPCGDTVEVKCRVTEHHAEIGCACIRLRELGAHQLRVGAPESGQCDKGPVIALPLVLQVQRLTHGACGVGIGGSELRWKPALLGAESAALQRMGDKKKWPE